MLTETRCQDGVEQLLIDIVQACIFLSLIFFLFTHCIEMLLNIMSVITVNARTVGQNRKALINRKENISLKCKYKFQGDDHPFPTNHAHDRGKRVRLCYGLCLMCVQ